MENYEKKNGLGIAAFVLGVIGFVTAFLGIGIVLDIIAIILGIIAIASKKQKSGLGIAGVCVAGASLLIMLFLGNVISDYVDDNKATKITSEPVATGVTTEQVSEPTSELEDEESDDISRDQIDIVEYSYENSLGSAMHYLVIKNNSDFTITVSSNTTALDANGGILGAGNGELNALGSGEESIIMEYFDSVKDVAKFDYTLTVKKDNYYKSVIPDLNSEITEADNKLVVTSTNQGEKAAQFVEAHGLFFKEGKLVYGTSTYITDDDSEIKPGATISQELNCYEEYDDYKVYFTGRR